MKAACWEGRWKVRVQDARRGYEMFADKVDNREKLLLSTSP